mgnify:CR=1 FL=1
MTVVVICVVVVAVLAFISGIRERNSKGLKTAKEGKNHPDNSTGKPGGALADYDSYDMTLSERIKYFALAAVFLTAIGYIFFKNGYICIVLASLSVFYPRVKKRDLVNKQKCRLNSQFNDALYSLSSSLCAGKSPESAFKAALADLGIIYPEGNAHIIAELELINRKIEMNETMESALADFAARAKIEDITNFVDVFSICKNTGGNLVEVIKNTSSVISQKIEIKNEIEVLVAEQKFSQKVLNIMPFALIVLISASSPDYIQPLYEAKGRIAMLIVLLLLALSYHIGSKISDIKV